MCRKADCKVILQKKNETAQLNSAPCELPCIHAMREQTDATAAAEAQVKLCCPLVVKSRNTREKILQTQ